MTTLTQGSLTQGTVLCVGNTYTYNVEDVRVRNLCGESETTYAYNTNGRLSQLLVKTTDGVVTKYVYGLGLIGEETSDSFKTYHFDYRGSTTAITDINGNVTDTFTYDTYGNLISRTGTSVVIFLYNGRDGVVTDDNGLIYMRARYYSPELRRFINADIIAGEISNAVTLNRYAYANGNPVSNIDPFGLSAERGWTTGDTVHTALDAAGLIPGWGMIFDGVNAIWYLFEGDWANAGFSALAFVPVIGDIAGVGKTGYKGVKITTTVISGIDDVKDTTKTLDILSDVGKSTDLLHGNSLKTTKPAVGYVLLDKDTYEILKYGETTRGVKRYTNKFYIENNAYMDILEYGTKYDMHYWQHEQIIEYYNKNGHLPPLNKSFW